VNITRHEHPASPSDPGFALVEAEAALWRGVVVDMFGDEDLADGPLARWSEGSRPSYFQHVRYAARTDDGRVVGVGTLELPQRDNPHRAGMSIVVDPAFRNAGVGTSLHAAMLGEARRGGRRTFEAFTWEPLEPTGPRRLSGVEGDGVIDPDGEPAAFLLGLGYRLVQVETLSVLDLPAQADLDRDVAEARAVVPEEYSLVQWRGVTPAEWRSDMAELQVAMSTDVPMGDADAEPSVVDPERVRSADESFLAGGRDLLFTAARHDPTGRLVAFTRLVHEQGRPVADQWETLVVQAHRGHGLGLLTKTANHAAVPEAWPDVRRLITGNASENRWMLAINRRLGYRPVAACGWFEHRLETP